jgi:uridylate kinase
MNGKKRVLLKLTGNALLDRESNLLSTETIKSLAQQIITLSLSHQFGIVVGGGNFFRGSQHGTRLGLTPAVGHQIGMLATMMNGAIIQDIFEQYGIQTTLFSALTCPTIGQVISQQALGHALEQGHTLIFSGGTGVPFVTTDTNAVIRACQIGAHEVWKATTVDGVYSTDPHHDASAQRLRQLSYAKALTDHLAIVDTTALVLGLENALQIRVFNIFEKNALVQAAEQPLFGSTIR